MTQAADRKTIYSYAYRRSADQDAPAPVRRPAVVVGAGPLSEEAAAALDTRLVLILANHIGDLDVLKEAIALAKGGAR